MEEEETICLPEREPGEQQLEELDIEYEECLIFEALRSAGVGSARERESRTWKQRLQWPPI